jgi:hypothetical protein
VTGEQIDLGGGDGDAATGVVALVVAVVEVLTETLEREALRRMEGGELTDEEVERVGAQLARIDAELERLEREEGIEDAVADFREDLDGLLRDAFERLDEEEVGERPGHTLLGETDE